MTISMTPSRLSRVGKASVALAIFHNLEIRAQKGPAETVLDAYMPALASVGQRLSDFVEGKNEVSATHTANVILSEDADCDVDVLCKHVESFLYIEGHRRRGAYVQAAKTLYDAVFPNGTSFVDDAIPDENTIVAAVLTKLRAPEHQTTLANIKFPLVWLDALEVAVEKSNKAYNDRMAALSQSLDVVSRAKETETEWLDVVTRLRKYIASRAPAGDLEKAHENKELLRPLDEAMAKEKALAKSRATRRTKKAGEGTGAGTEAPTPTPTATPQ